MSIFVINEWLWSDSSGENGMDAQRHAFEAIHRLATLDHRIVIIEGSAFDRKAWSLCKSSNTIVTALVKTFITGIRLNSEKCIALKPEEACVLTADLKSNPSLNVDDHYLVRAQLSEAGAVLVTTDSKLRGVVSGVGLPCISREEFLLIVLPSSV